MASGLGRRGGGLPAGAEVVVVGAGIVGTAIAWRLASAGLEVCLLERGRPAGGSSSSGEGNLLVSDKLPGPELELARRSLELWHRLVEELGEELGEELELADKGGLVVAHDEAQLAALESLALEQRRAGVEVELCGPAELAELEPLLARDLAGGAFYAQDCQVQPMRAVAAQLRRARASGCSIVAGTEVTAARRDESGAIVGLRTTAGEIAVRGFVVDAAGPWAGELAERLGGSLPVVPRRGHVLVTEPVSPITPHKVYEADYVSTIHDGGGFACSSVVESTPAGTMLLGSSREFVGFASAPEESVVRAIAARAVALFPALAAVRLMRVYVGFRPATPDRLPVIGPDPEVGRLLHASGHEGAGIGLSQATAELVEALVRGEAHQLAAAFDPRRFAAGDSGGEAAAEAAPRGRHRAEASPRGGAR